MIKAVIFDLDGTLLDTITDLANASNTALRTLGYPEHEVEAYKQFVGDGRRNLILRMLPEAAAKDEGIVAKAEALFDEAYHAHMLDCTVPYPGIPELLELLCKEKLKLAVVSNKPDEFVQRIVEDYFPGIFDAVCGQVGSVVKPDPAGVHKVLSVLRLRPYEALYVGDSAVDVMTARNAGTDCCGVTWGFRGRRELRVAGAPHIIDAPFELTPIALPRETSKAVRFFSLFVVVVMVLCLVGVIYSLATGNVGGTTAGLIFPVLLGFAATRMIKKK